MTTLRLRLRRLAALTAASCLLVGVAAQPASAAKPTKSATSGDLVIVNVSNNTFNFTFNDSTFNFYF